MRLRIEIDGKPENTKIVNAETGETVIGITHAEVLIDPFEVQAILVLNNFEAVIETDKVIVEAQDNS